MPEVKIIPTRTTVTKAGSIVNIFTEYFQGVLNKVLQVGILTNPTLIKGFVDVATTPPIISGSETYLEGEGVAVIEGVNVALRNDNGELIINEVNSDKYFLRSQSGNLYFINDTIEKLLAFNGIDEYLLLGTASDVQYSSLENFAIAFTIEQNTLTSNMRILSSLNSVTNRGLQIIANQGTNTGSIQFRLAQSNTRAITVRTPNGVIVDGQKYRVVIAYQFINNGVGWGDASGVRIWINGVLQTLTIVNNNLIDDTISTNYFVACNSNLTNFFNGELDQLAIYGTHNIDSIIADLSVTTPFDLNLLPIKPKHYWAGRMCDLDNIYGVIDLGSSLEKMDGTAVNMSNEDNLIDY